MDNILSTVIKTTYSLTQFKHRLSVLKSYFLQNFFNTEGQIASLPDDSAWLKSLPDQLIKSFNKDNIYKIFEDLEKQISTIKALTIYLTFEPDNESLKQIGERARKTFGNPTLLLDVKYDPKLIAGAALSWNGLYRDYSLREKIEERKLAVLESFKSFLR